MKIVSITSIIQLNKLMEEKNAGIKIHLKDACGKQSMRIEMLSGTSVGDEVYQLIDSFFNAERMSTEYSFDRMTFWIKD